MKAARIFFRMVCALVLVLAVVEIAWVRHAQSAEEPKTVEQGTSAAAAEKTTTAAPAKSEAVAQELENKRLAIEDRERTVEDRELRLKEREKELDKKIKEMEHLREVVSGELEGQRKNNEERVVKLVAVFETMTPKSAASVFETLDDWLAVEALKKMDVKRVAKIMNIMEKTRSAKLSEMLTGYYRPENDRKISSIKQTASGQGTAAAQQAQPTAQQAQVTAPAQATQTPVQQAVARAPASQAPQNLKKGGGEK